MEKDSKAEKNKTFIEPLRWCRYLVSAGYVTVGLIILAHVIWFFAADRILAHPRGVYLRDYIVFPGIGLFLMNLIVDLLIRSERVPLAVKERLSLMLFSLFAFYLCYTHDIAKVLLGAFVLPIFVSTLFSDLKITRWVFLLSCFLLLVLTLVHTLMGIMDGDRVMQVFVAVFMYGCAYLLAKIIIRYGKDQLATLTAFYNRQQAMQEQLKLDPFTGLYNRKTYDGYLAELLAECRSAGKCVSLAMIDLDHFKRINDLYGHASGDQVILYLAKILKDHQAQNIRAFRIGGEEFTVVFRDCEAAEAFQICEAMRKQMALATVAEIAQQTVTFSCGLVCLPPNQNEVEVYAKAADSALYTAKNNGRNQVVIYRDAQ